jgi:hypothetical protein
MSTRRGLKAPLAGEASTSPAKKRALHPGSARSRLAGKGEVYP